MFLNAWRWSSSILGKWVELLSPPSPQEEMGSVTAETLLCVAQCVYCHSLSTGNDIGTQSHF